MLGRGESEIKKQERFYLRYHNSITRAIELNKKIFGDKLSKDGIEMCFQHSLRVAGCCEEILDQTMLQYHQGWLVGIMHDLKEQNLAMYSRQIDYVLQDLKPDEQQDIKRYIDHLTSDELQSKGYKKRQQLQRAKQLELIPSWILLFDKMDNCQRFIKNPCKKSAEQLQGYFSVAYLIYLTLKKRHPQIKNFLLQSNHDFYEDLGKRVGGKEEANKKAERYFRSYS